MSVWSGRFVGPEIETIDWVFRREGAAIHKFCTFFLMLAGDGDAAPQLDEGITAVRWLPIAEGAEEIIYSNTKNVVRTAVQTLEKVDW